MDEGGVEAIRGAGGEGKGGRWVRQGPPTEYYRDKYSTSTETNFWASMYIDFTVQYQFNLSLDIALS